MTAYRSRSLPSGSNRLHAGRTRLLVGSAFGALALAGHAGAAHAQAINATPATVAGNVTYSRITSPTPGSETITVETPSAIINWTPPAGPLPNPYVFLPQGNTVTYQNGINTTDFAVLNRILTNTPSRFDGHVISQIRNPASGLFNSGGTVLFSSPGGIIIGPTAVFDVGNLVLTTLNVVDDGSGNFGDASTGFQFNGGGSNPNAAVVTLPRSQINATSTNSFIALVAPVVNVGGNARVNGSVGYIAGEELSFTVNAGLFDITITTGSDNATPITHSGNTGGPASTGSGDAQNIYMVAVPKNQAITMLLTGGTVGYDAASSASIENGEIVLSAGYNVVGGFRGEVNPALNANISIQGGTYTSDVIGQASGNAVATATQASPLIFKDSLFLRGGTLAQLTADTNASVTISDDLTLIGFDVTSQAASVARLEARAGSTVSITGDANISADNVQPPGFRDVGDGEDRQGGTASAVTLGGAVTVGGDLNVTANAIGGSGTFSGGDGTGGTAFVEADSGSIGVTGDTNVFAIGAGGFSPGVAGNGQGGTARLSALGGTVSSGGQIYVNAGAVGGSRVGFGTQPGTGTGGTATLESSGAGSAVTGASALVVADAGQLVIPAGVLGASGPTAIGPTGAAQAGTATVTVDGGKLTVDGLLVSASAIGGRGIDGRLLTDDGTSGFDATGGTAQITVDGGTFSVTSLFALAFANGGDGGDGFGGGDGGTATGGRATVSISNVSNNFDSVDVATGGFGGNGGLGNDDDSGFTGPGGNGGAGTGGTSEMVVGPGANLTASVLEIDANGGGGGGGPGGTGSKFGSDGGLGADGAGGSATLRVTGGDLAVFSSDGFAVLAEGFGGAGGNGGSSANGAAGVGGDGGGAAGGTALVDLAGGSITSTGADVDSRGIGGFGGTGGTGTTGTLATGQAGFGTGGLSRIALADGDTRSGTALLGATSLLADGINGLGTSSPSDTAGVTIFDNTATGLVQLDSLDVTALGGRSADGRGFAFTATGLVTVNGDATINVTGDVSFDLTGSGGLIVTNPGVGDADLSVVTAGSITIDHQSRQGSFSLAGDSVSLTAQGDVTGNADSLIGAGYRDLTVSGANISLGQLFGARDIALDAPGDIAVGLAIAGDDFTASAGATFTGGTVNTTGQGDDTEADTTLFLVGSNVDVITGRDLRLDNSNAADKIRLQTIDGNVASAGLLEAGDSLRIVAGIDTGNPLNISLNNANAGTTIDLRAPGNLTGNNLNAGGNITAFIGGVVDLGTIVSGGTVLIDPTDITIDSVTAADDITLRADGNIDVGFAQAGDDFVALAGGTFTGGTVVVTGLGPDNEAATGGAGVGSNILVNAVGDVRLDNGTAPDTINLTSQNGSIFSDGTLAADTLLASTAGDLDLNDVFVTTALNLTANNGFIDGNSFNSDGDITLRAGNGITVTGLDTGGSLLIKTSGAVTLGTIVAVKDIIIDPTDITIGSATAGGDIDLTASNNISINFAQAGDDFTASAGNDFTGGNVIATGLGTDSEKGVGTLAGGNIVVIAGNDLRLDNGNAAADIRLTTRTGSIFSDGLLTAGSDIFGFAGQDIDVNDADAGEQISLNAGGFIDTGDITAGTDITLLADGGNVTVASAQAGDDFLANAGGAFTGGTVTVTGAAPTDESSGPLVGNNIVVAANSDVRLDNGTAPDRIELTSTNGSILSAGTLTADQLLADAALDILLNDVFVISALNLTTPGGSIGGNSFNSNGNISLDAAANVTVNGATSGGSIAVNSGGNATLGTFVAAGRIDVNSNALLSFTSATAGTDVNLVSSGNMSVGTARAGDDFTAISNNGTFTGGSVTTGGGTDTEGGAGAFAGSNIFVSANGDLRLDNGSSPGRIGLGSSTGSILSSGTLAANRVTAFAARNLALTNVNAVAPLVLTTTNGNITGNNFTSAGDVTLTSSGTIGLNRANSGGDIVLRSVGNLRLDAGTATGRIDLASSTADVLSGGGGSDSVGTLTAGTDILANAARDVILGGAQAGRTVDVDAVRLARFTGNVSAPTIDVTSADIDIAGGAFGNSSTQLVALNVRPSSNPAVLGGSTQGPGYTLTDAEADRISAVTLRITAPAAGSAASRAADLQIRDLSLAGAQIRTLQLVTPGIAEVNGNLILSGVQANGGISIQATERLQIVNPSGSIRVRDGSGLTAGSLSLTSNNIWSATQTILTQLLADSNFAGRDAALLQPSGSDAERGSIEGGTTTLSARDSLFVQNTGSPAVFGGITVRQNTLTIVPTGTSPLRVFAFGRRINPDGTFVTNTAFFREVIFQTRLATPGFTNDAEFNRCFINSGACAGDNFPGGKDIIDGPVESNVNLGLPVNADDLVDTSFAQESLIEEPVTSGADSIQWDCDTDDDGDCDEDDVNG